jgi:HlyD family secretion protein
MPTFTRVKALACIAALGALGSGASASAQARKAGPDSRQPVSSAEPTGRRDISVFNQVGGVTTIVSIKPDGSRVKKGELVCELDAASLKETMEYQGIAIKEAEAAVQHAQRTRDVAQSALTEYVEGLFPQELQTVSGEVSLAESELKRADGRAALSKRMFEKGMLPKRNKITDELLLQKAKFRLEQAQAKKNVLEKYTKSKMTKELMTQVEKAKSDEVAKKALQAFEEAKQDRLRKQIDRCKMFAPVSGHLYYSRTDEEAAARVIDEDTPRPIEPGASVREGQFLFRIIPEGEPAARAK